MKILRFNLVQMLLIAFGVATMMSLINSCQANREKNALAAQISAYMDSTRYYKNKYGKEVASRAAVVGTKKEVEKFYDLSGIAKLFNVRKKDIQSHAEITSQASASIQPASKAEIVYRDTAVAYMQQQFASPYYRLNVRVGDSAFARLAAYDTLHVAQIRAYRRHFLRKEYYTTIAVTNANPDVHNTITGSFVIKDREPLNYLDIKGQAAAVYVLGTRPRLFAGVEAEYTRGRTSLFASYNTSPTAIGKELLMGGIRYRLIRL